MLNRKNNRLKRAQKTRVIIKISKLPRLVVFKSNKHIYASIVSAEGGRVLACVSTLSKEFAQDKQNKQNNEQQNNELLVKTSNVEGAKLIGKMIAEKSKVLGVVKVAFDRAGYAYHGKVKALADAARENGLVF